MSKIIVLDLGSESMCALIGDSNNINNLKEIDMQCLENISIWEDRDLYSTTRKYSPFLLKSEGKLSKRLQNRIELVDNTADFIESTKELDSKHALLDFNSGNYNDSIFRFYNTGSATGSKYLCNPKIASVNGVDEILPYIKSRNGVKCKISPISYIKHLTVQVVNNLLMYAPECNDLDLDDCKLVLSFPNVYSRTHLYEIVEFVKLYSRYKKVDFLYESDASIYAAIGAPVLKLLDVFTGDAKTIIDRIEKGINELSSADVVDYNVLSIDVGKGTTDLSLVNISGAKAEKKKIKVLARSGIAKAGNSLDYIIVTYLNEVIKTFEQQRSIKFDFDLIHKSSTNASSSQPVVCQIAQKIALEIKKNIRSSNNGYRLDYAYFRKLIKAYFSYEKDKNTMDNSLIELFIELADELSNKSLDDENRELFVLFFVRSLFKSNTAFLNSKFLLNPPLSSSLSEAIKEYVDIIGDELIAILSHNMKIRAKLMDGEEDFVLDKSNTFVVVTGQAAQFEPISLRIRKSLYSNFNVSKANIFYTIGEFSKTVCCLGGYLKHFLSGFEELNSHELLADYFIKDPTGPIEYLSYSKLNNSEAVEIHSYNSMLFMYSTILEVSSYRMKYGIDEKMFHGIVTTVDPGKYDVTYSREGHIFIGDEAIKLQSFGINNKDVYDGVWPEVLKD